jgi:hypothetical protein
MANLTLYDLAVLQRNDPYTGLIEDVTTLAPEFTIMPAHKREGWWYEAVQRVTLPTVGFRSANEGVATSRSTYKKTVKEMLYIDCELQLDEMVNDGADGAIGAPWQLEAKGAMESSAILIGQQMYYGVSCDAKGFIGLRAQLAGSVKAGGTTNSTSAYLVWENEKEGVRFDVGMNGSFAISPPRLQQVLDSSNSSQVYHAYVGNLKGYVGLFVGSQLSCWAITGIGTNTANALANPFTDAAAFQLLGKIPIARRNNLRWFYNRTAEAMLRQSRSAVTVATGMAQYQPADAGGFPAYAPLPERLAGIPITVTDSILNTETNS